MLLIRAIGLLGLRNFALTMANDNGDISIALRSISLLLDSPSGRINQQDHVGLRCFLKLARRVERQMRLNKVVVLNKVKQFLVSSFTNNDALVKLHCFDICIGWSFDWLYSVGMHDISSKYERAQ